MDIYMLPDKIIEGVLETYRGLVEAGVSATLTEGGAIKCYGNKK